MIDVTHIIDAKVHLGDLLVSGVGISLAWGMRMIVKAIKLAIYQAEKVAYVVDTHTYVLARSTGWQPSPSMFFNPGRRFDDQTFDKKGQ